MKQRISLGLTVTVALLLLGTAVFSTSIVGVAKWSAARESSFNGRSFDLPVGWHEEANEVSEPGVEWVKSRPNLFDPFDNIVTPAPPYGKVGVPIDMKQWESVYGDVLASVKVEGEWVKQMNQADVVCSSLKKSGAQNDQVALACVSQDSGITLTYSGSGSQLDSGLLIIRRALGK